MTASILTLDLLRSLLHYDPDTGIFTWKVSPSQRVKAGSIAGTINSRRYRIIQICGKLHTEHRLAWFYMMGEWPVDQIDHINRIKTDNRIVNLRPATNSQNVQNTKIRRNNSSGYKGVSWWNHRGKWAAQIRVAGKNHLLGMFESAIDAHNSYQLCAALFHSHRLEV